MLPGKVTFSISFTSAGKRHFLWTAGWRTTNLTKPNGEYRVERKRFAFNYKMGGILEWTERRSPVWEKLIEGDARILPTDKRGLLFTRVFEYIFAAVSWAHADIRGAFKAAGACCEFIGPIRRVQVQKKAQSHNVLSRSHEWVRIIGGKTRRADLAG